MPTQTPQPDRRFLAEPPAHLDPSWLEVDLAQLEANVRAVKAALPEGTRLCGVVKKDAYGLGAEYVAHKLGPAGCDMLAVWSPSEAEHLIQKAITGPILILMPVRNFSRTGVLYRHAVADKLHLAIHDLEQLRALNDVGRTFGMKLRVHLFLDTGMSRGALNEAQFDAAVQELTAMRYIRVSGVYTHLATAEKGAAFSLEQLQRYQAVVERHRDALPQDVVLHVANSYGLLRGEAFFEQMVRPGLLLYGYAALPEPAEGNVDETRLDKAVDCRPIARWMSRLVHVQKYPKRTPVGYGSTKKLRRESVLGLVPVGYADGYPLALSSKAPARVFDDTGRLLGDAMQIGQVNMDQITIDLTDLVAAGHTPEALNGATVELYSHDPEAPNAVTKLAAIAKSHPYELLTRIHPSVPRKYDVRKPGVHG